MCTVHTTPNILTQRNLHICAFSKYYVGYALLSRSQIVIRLFSPVIIGGLF